ncbi:hypothetical protein C5167_050069 [Papaver somniferum]|uniref:Uncharacterized protein n=1 Tax=Papaver somniferum TaxID=3469 RepID=A0A4Y7KRJ1_PAPSO|nr:hypothetical protein C5167_050069 [Papaver somniferum]
MQVTHNLILPLQLNYKFVKRNCRNGFLNVGVRGIAGVAPDLERAAKEQGGESNSKGGEKMLIKVGDPRYLQCTLFKKARRLSQNLIDMNENMKAHHFSY